MNFQAILQQREREQLTRSRLCRDNATDVDIVIEGQRLINFSSNDYLGLANHAEVKQAFIDGIHYYGCGSGASALVTGYTKAARDCEQAFADFFGYERTLLFGSGFLANLGVLTALADKDTFIAHDKDNHASLIDAVKQTPASHGRYRNLRHCHQRLHTSSCRKLIVSDGVFSMSGVVADLVQLQTLAKSFTAMTIIDDAHGVGVLGEQGRGIIELSHLKPDILVCPMGKALGGYGAIVAASDEVIEMILQYARSLIYTTAPPPALAQAMIASLGVLQHDHARRHRLQENIALAQHLLGDYIAQKNGTAILAIPCGDCDTALRLEQLLQQRGFLLRAMRYPTVPKQQAQCRMTLSAAHTPAMIKDVANAIKDSYDLVCA